MDLKLEVVAFEKPEDVNVVFGMSHFIKTVEDVHEAMVTAAPGIRFGVAFCEASGDRLIRRSGNDEALVALAVDNARKVGAGHTFLVAMRGGFPINVMHALKAVPEIGKAIASPDGNIYALPLVAMDDYHLTMRQKAFINKSWLDRLGLDMPTTTEEF